MIGVVLAGGAGTRMGGGKPARLYGGRPLISYPLAALGEACTQVAVVAKAHTQLPPLAGAERWDEPEEPLHPLTGIVHALERAGEEVLVCAADMPNVTAEACRALIGARAIAESGDGVLQPVFGVYLPEWLPALRAAPAGAPLTRTVEALASRRLTLPAALVRSVDSPALCAAPAGAPLTRTVEALASRRLTLPAALVRSVDSPADLNDTPIPPSKQDGPATREG